MQRVKNIKGRRDVSKKTHALLSRSKSTAFASSNPGVANHGKENQQVSTTFPSSGSTLISRVSIHVLFVIPIVQTQQQRYSNDELTPPSLANPCQSRPVLCFLSNKTQHTQSIKSHTLDMDAHLTAKLGHSAGLATES
jgi:hypothetical protein